METFIEFAYTGEIKLNEKNVQTLLEDADYIGLVDVKNECEKFLESCINCHNIFEIDCLADKLSCTSLKESCYQFIRKNFQAMTKTDEYLNIDFIILKNILTNNRFRIDYQEKIFEAVMRWIIFDISQRRGYLKDLLQLVKLAHLNTDYLVNFFFKGEMVAVTNQNT